MIELDRQWFEEHEVSLQAYDVVEHSGLMQMDLFDSEL